MRVVLLVLVTTSAVACSGSIGDRGASTEGAPGQEGAPGAGPAGPDPGPRAQAGASGTTTATGCQVAEGELLPTRVWRLSTPQYRSAVTALLPGADLAVTRGFLPDERLGAFSNDATSLRVSRSRADQYQRAARAFGAEAAKAADKRLACAPGAAPADCGRAFARGFAASAFRRDLDPTEIAAFEAIYAEGQAADANGGGVAAVVETALQAPSFLYRTELGGTVDGKSQRIALSPAELASFLSFSLTDAPPDRPLLDAARGGTLARADVLEREARRLLDSDAGRAHIANFVSEWLGYDALDEQQKTESGYKDFASAWVPRMQRELDLFVDDVLRRDGKLATLLSSTTTFVDGGLAKLYGLSQTGTTMQKVSLDPSQRAGVLTLSGFLAGHAVDSESHPIKRGLFVNERVVCRPAPPPPEGAATLNDAAKKPGLTAKERLAAHQASPQCAGCHRFIDAPGFALERFDGLGRYRTTDGNKPIDTSGQFPIDDQTTLPFSGAVDLAKKLAESPTVAACFARMDDRFLMGAGEPPADGCVMRDIQARFAASGGDLRELAIAIVTSPAATHRRIANGETP